MPLFGIWKPNKDSKIQETFHFEKPINSATLPMTLVHGVTENGAFIRGCIDAGCENDEWILNGMSIEDSCIERFQVSFRENEYSCSIGKDKYKCMKSSEAPTLGVPLTGILLSKTPEKETLPAGYSCVSTTVGGEPANVGSKSTPLYLCTRHGGDFPPIAEVFVIWKGIENVPQNAVMVDGN